MRIIIAGGRDFNDYELLSKHCNEILKYAEDDCEITGREQCEVVCGLAKGADLLGKKYALEHHIKLKEFPANWDLYGKCAGYKRNAEMLNYAKQNNGVLIAFWDGESKGTKNMIDTSKKAGIRVITFSY